MKISIAENVKTETERVFCDMCFEECMDNRYVCSICERDICRPCFGNLTKIKELPVMPCPICRKIRKYTPKISRAWDLSAFYSKRAFKLQEQWGKESRESE